jgi:hypothetical protein
MNPPYTSHANLLSRPSHMTKLFQLCRTEHKIWKELPNGDHNNTVAEKGYFDYIEDFLSKHVDK